MFSAVYSDLNSGLLKISLVDQENMNILFNSMQKFYLKKKIIRVKCLKILFRANSRIHPNARRTNKTQSITIRPTMLYGTEYWIIKKQCIHKTSISEMRMLRQIGGNIQKDRVQNNEICLKIGVVPIDEKIRKSYLTWFGYVQRKTTYAPIKKNELIQVEETKKDRGRPKITLVDMIKNDISIKGVSKKYNNRQSRMKTKNI